MGASGIGKTTILNLIMGLTKPDSGEILGMHGREIAAVFQEDRLIDHWSAIKNIRLVCDKEISDQQLEQEFLEVGLVDIKDKPVKYFSGGMRRRVAIVRAMLAKSDVVILDEPLKGLDEALKLQMIDYIRQRTKGKTVIVVTHDKDEAVQLEATVINLNKTD